MALLFKKYMSIILELYGAKDALNVGLMPHIYVILFFLFINFKNYLL